MKGACATTIPRWKQDRNAHLQIVNSASSPVFALPDRRSVHSGRAWETRTQALRGTLSVRRYRRPDSADSLLCFAKRS